MSSGVIKYVKGERTRWMAMTALLIAASIGLAACGASHRSAAAVNVPTPTPVASPSPTAETSPSPSPLPSPRPDERVLAVQIHYQEHRLSCEAAALEMALAYLGISIDELTLIDFMGHETQPARFDSNGRLVGWGDPNRGFVGDPDGHLESYTGYGVYFAPVARAAVLARVHVVTSGSGLFGSGIAPADLYNAVLDGHPAVAWISNTYHEVPLASYTAEDGSTVWYTLTEHAVAIIGVRPDAVLINDPWFGQSWHPKAQFESAYQTFQNMAVIIAY